MARQKYTHNSFSLGFLSEKARGNTEFEGYNNALSECTNFIIENTGGCFKRGGTYFVSHTKNNQEALLIPFQYSSEEAYVCEFTDNCIRYFSKYGLLANDEGNPVETPTPFSLKEIKEFKHFQQGNLLFFVTKDGIYILERLSAIEFDFYGPEDYTVEPMDFVNTEDIALKPDNKGWDSSKKRVKPIKIIPLDATPDEGEDEDINDPRPEFEYAPIFFPSDVTHYLVLNYYHPEEGNKKYYLKITDVVEDEWKNPIYPTKTTGFNRITAIIDTNLSPATEERDADNNLTGNMIYQLPTLDKVVKWQIAAFTKGTGAEFTVKYEDAEGIHEKKCIDEGRGELKVAAIFEGRLFLSDGNAIWGSAVSDSDYFNFQLGNNAGDAVQFKADTSGDGICWLASQSKLFAGTKNGIYIAGSVSYNDEAITPDNFRVRLFEKVGASALQPVIAMDTVLFADAVEQNVHEIILSSETGAYEAQDLSLLANDLTKSNITSHTWQQTPSKLYWCSVKKGYLCALTYLKSNGIIAWSKHIISGKNVKVDSLITLHQDKEDTIWMIVTREINKKMQRCIEYMHPSYDSSNEENFRQFYVDSGIIKEIKYSVNYIELSQNAHVEFTIDPKYIKNINLWYVIFHKSKEVTDDHPFITYKPFAVRNITSIGFDVFEDLRSFNNPDVLYGTFNSKHWLSYKQKPVFEDVWRPIYDETIDLDLYTKICDIENIETGKETIIYCNSFYLSPTDKIIIYNSGIKEIDYTKDNIVTFDLFKNTNTQLRLRQRNNKVSSSGNYKSGGEIYKKIGTIKGKKSETERAEYSVGRPTLIYVKDKTLYDLMHLKKLESSNIYINKVFGTTQINNIKYRIKYYGSIFIWDDETHYTTYSYIIPGDYRKSPNKRNIFTLDSSDYYLYDQTIENNGNIYLYFTIVENLEHLLYQEVAICANGNNVTQIISPQDKNRQISPRVDIYNKGQDNEFTGIKLPHEVMWCAVGLKIESVFETLPFSGGSALGSSVGSVGSQSKATLYLYNSLGGKYGSSQEKLYDIPYMDSQVVYFDRPKDLYTGLIQIAIINDYNVKERRVVIKHDEPVSFNVLSLTRDIEVSDA